MDTNTIIADRLFSLKEMLDQKEQGFLSPLAALNRDGVRRSPETLQGHRQNFSLDADRILHSRAYTRYIDKTQVFYLIDNDHITHRVLHVQLVSKIARTMGRFLGLNEDLIEAIALGHDIGHPPFGHDGEKFLSELCLEYGLPPFLHNVQSVLFLDRIEKKGRGLNLTIQTLDGILCHDGEVHDLELRPRRGKTFADFDGEVAIKSSAPTTELVPMTLEGCLVRFADTVSYIGRDIEDAIELKLISRDDIPTACQDLLGRSNGTIVYHLVADLIANSLEQDAISFSRPVSDSLQELKQFNYEKIYRNPVIKKDIDKIRSGYRALFESAVNTITRQDREAEIFTGFLNQMQPAYLETSEPAAIARDFIAGMTDDYFLRQAARLG